MDLQLKDKVILVTGSGRGIGAAVVRSLAAEGAIPVIHYRSAKEEAQALAEEIRGQGVRTLVLQGDLKDAGVIPSMLEQIDRVFGRLDGLVNNAGEAAAKKFMDTNREEWGKSIQANLYAVLELTQQAVRRMGNGGSVVQIIGDSTLTGDRQTSLVNLARGGVVSATKIIAREVAERGVRLNIVSLGMVKTHSASWITEEIEQKMLRNYPLGRLGLPEDVTGAVLMLLSPLTSWVTGQVWRINGGYSM